MCFQGGQVSAAGSSPQVQNRLDELEKENKDLRKSECTVSRCVAFLTTSGPMAAGRCRLSDQGLLFFGPLEWSGF